MAGPSMAFLESPADSGSRRHDQLVPGIHLVGCNDDASIQIADRSVSARHAQLHWDGKSQLRLMDLQSAGGTAVNGTRVGVDWTALRDGDVLTFGGMKMQVRLQISDVPPTAAGPVITNSGGNQVVAIGGATIDLSRTYDHRQSLETRDADSPPVVNVLVLSSDPLDERRLRLGQEMRDIEDAVRGDQRVRLRFHQQQATRIQDLVRQVATTAPQILHFSGHGSQDGSLMFEDRDGFATAVNPVALRGLLEAVGGNLRCVVLNACYSAKQADSITDVVPAVVGTYAKIHDSQAISFACAFYLGISQGLSVARSFALGRAQMNLEGLPSVGAPELLLASEDVELV